MTHESWVNFDRISFTFSRLVSRNSGRWVWASTLRVHKVFTKTGWGPWLRGDSLPWARWCNKLHSTICIVLLSEFVSQNMWLQQTHVAGTQAQPKPCLGLKPSQNPWYLVPWPHEAQFLDVSSQKEFSERQSDREEVDLFRFPRQTHSTECGPPQRASMAAVNCGMLSFYRRGNFIC